MKRFLIFLLMISFAFACDKEEIGQSPASFSLQTSSFTEGNQQQSIELLIQATGGGSNLTAEYKLTGHTAKVDTDFSASSGIVEFQDGEGVITLEMIGDTHLELNESLYLTLSHAENPVTFTIEIIDDDAPAAILEDEAGFYTPENYTSMDRIWSDEFEGDRLKEDYWTYELGDGCDNDLCGWGNNELQSYTNDLENIRVEDGYLTIKAIENEQQFTSARIITQDKVEEQYGRIDIRAKLPKGQGLWPALWMLGANINEVSWPACGEIDIMELVGHEPDIVHGTLHYDNGAGYATNSSGYSLSFEDFSDRFHVFTLVWDQNKIEWYVDNQPFKSYVKSEGEQYPFNQPFFFIFNIAVGGNWPGNPDATTVFPQEMVVDYIRMFR